MSCYLGCECRHSCEQAQSALCDACPANALAQLGFEGFDVSARECLYEYGMLIRPRDRVIDVVYELTGKRTADHIAVVLTTIDNKAVLDAFPGAGSDGFVQFLGREIGSQERLTASVLYALAQYHGCTNVFGTSPGREFTLEIPRRG